MSIIVLSDKSDESDKSDSADRRCPPPLHLSEVLTAVDFPAVHPDRGSLPRATLHYERPLAGSRESSGHPLPGSSGLTPLRHPGYEKRTSPRCSLTLFLNQQPIEETSQRAVPLVRQRQDQPAVHPDRGAFFIARASRHEVPKTPGYRQYALYIRPRQGGAPSVRLVRPARS